MLRYCDQFVNAGDRKIAGSYEADLRTFPKVKIYLIKKLEIVQKFMEAAGKGSDFNNQLDNFFEALEPIYNKEYEEAVMEERERHKERDHERSVDAMNRWKNR